MLLKFKLLHTIGYSHRHRWTGTLRTRARQPCRRCRLVWKIWKVESIGLHEFLVLSVGTRTHKPCVLTGPSQAPEPRMVSNMYKRKVGNLSAFQSLKASPNARHDWKGRIKCPTGLYGCTTRMPSLHACKTEERLYSLFLMSMKDLAIFQTEKESWTLFSYPPAFLFRLDGLSAKLHNFHHISNTFGILFYIFFIF